MSELYAQLFPTGVPQAAPAAAAQVAVPEPSEDAGLVLGPFRVRASIDARYADADIFVEVDAEPTRDRYLEVQPRVLAAAPVGAGAFTLEYSPVLRAFASHDQVNSSSHLLDGQLELPVGSRVTLRAGDRFQSGVLDTRVVDPGGEYFFGLGRFNRNDAEASASIVVGPRLSVELGAGLGHVHFLEDSTFFDYETRLATAGLGFELTPSLRAVASYVYDEVPRPDERPEAESTAHSARLALSGEILPLLSGELAVGYRSMDAPHAGAGGQSYSGLTLQASLQREFAREVRLALYATRSTPVSAFEENGFYVSTGVQGVLEVPLVARFEARGGLGYQWNDYQTIAQEIGAPREDRILGWFAALRRPIARKLALSAAYRREERRSNLDGVRHRRQRVLPAARVGPLRDDRPMSALLASVPLLALSVAGRSRRDRSALPRRPGRRDRGVGRRPPDLSRMPTVQTTGSIWLPRAGDVDVRGLTTTEISARITPLLAGGDLAAPHVAVRVAGYNSQFVWVQRRREPPGAQAAARRNPAGRRPARRGGLRAGRFRRGGG